MADPGAPPTLAQNLAGSTEKLEDAAKLFFHEIVRFAAGYGLRVVGAIVLLAMAWVISRWVRRRVARALNRPKLDATFAKFVSHSAGWGVLVLALIAMLSIFGVETNSVVAALGAAGIAVGLAMQGSLSNLAAGMMLLVLRPFKVGDTITVASVTGKVESIELFSTRVDTPDNRRVILPNSQIFGSVIDNQTHHHTRQVLVTIGVEYGAPTEAVRAAFLRATESVDGRIAAPAPTAILQALGASSVDWQVGVWCATPDVAKVRERLLIACKAALDEQGIAIPFPQTEVHTRPWTPPAPIQPGERSRLRPVAPAPIPALDEEE